MEVPTSRTLDRRDLPRLAAIGLGYLLAYEIAFIFPASERLVATVWPAAGVGLAALLVSPRRLWPAILAVLYATGLVANLFTGRPFLAGVGFMLANVLESYCSAWLIGRDRPDGVKFDRIPEMMGLIAAALLVNAGTATIGAATARLIHGAEFVSFWKAWWIADGFGLLLITPLVVAWSSAEERPVSVSWARGIEAAAFAGVWCATAWLSFHWSAASQGLFRPYQIMLLILWGAFRFGMRGLSLGFLALAAVAITGAARLDNPFFLGGETLADRTQVGQLFIAISAITGYLLSLSITETRRSASLATRSLERLDLATRAAGIGVWDWDIRNNILVWDDRMRDLYGIGKSGFGGDYGDWLARVHPGDREMAAAAIRDACTGVRDYDIEFRIAWPDGTERVLKAYGRVIRDPAGHPLRMTGINFDITADKRVAEEHERLQAQLLQSQKLESIGRLAGGVAHDFNNMLTVILTTTELALMEIDPAQPCREWLNETRSAALRSADLTRQLLAFARKQPVAPRDLDLNAAVADSLRMLRRLIGEHIDLAFTPGGAVWPIRIDPVQVDQLLANLCANARDAITGAGRIAIATGSVSVEVGSRPADSDAAPGDYATLTVTDNGRGMEAAVREHVFEPFFTTKELGQGTGLGLATVYGIVRQNGGFIDLWSEPGRGTAFTIHLPRLARPTAAESPAVAAVPPAQGNATILLVEDEPSILSTTRRILAGLGFTILAASGPEEALRLAETHAGEIELLLTDVVMPGMNGQELATRLLARRPRIRRLFMSGFDDEIIARNGNLETGIRFLPKPFTREELAAKVREALA